MAKNRYNIGMLLEEGETVLKIENVTKKYEIGTFKQTALNGVTMAFRDNEFVSILGPSGSGKTTLLNMIGGLDQYDSGDILIDGKSTKHFKDSEWDSYRNHSIGFVFQTYHLIPHISVLDNVEVGLTLSGMDSERRKQRAIEVLSRVGLEDHIYKKPNQLSGGQMQRVAIARALANDPDIILADEPTGALDSETSVQIMSLIQEIAKDKLVIMVTHNKEIAERYSNRIIELLDGRVIDDTNPHEIKESLGGKLTLKAISMSFKQALKLSFNNLRTKKFRTLITAFAGSIGIIGVALVLALSNGLSNEISTLERSTLSEFPITINQVPMNVDMGQGGPFAGAPVSLLEAYPDIFRIFPFDRDAQRVQHTNVFTDAYIEHLKAMDPLLYNEITFTQSANMPLIHRAENNAILTMNNRAVRFSPLLNNTDFFVETYDILDGRMPEMIHELLLVVDQYNRLNISILSALGYETDVEDYPFDRFIGKTIYLAFNDQFYLYDEDNDRFFVNPDLAGLMQSEDTMVLEIVGIARAKEDASVALIEPGLKYLPGLMDLFLADAMQSSIVEAQRNSDVNVINNQPLTSQAKQNLIRSYGGDDTPASILIYASSFEAKNLIKDYLDAFNIGLPPESQIIYSDLAAMITDVVGTLIGTVTYVLIAFSAISLVVSSIMIGIITYVSVLERTKEIGILRSLGARKKDISRVFNAETTIIGFTAGLMGVVLAYAMTFPINMVIRNLVDDVDNLAQLSIIAGASLIVISIGLTYVSGLIPANFAARKDPVEALRVE